MIPVQMSFLPGLGTSLANVFFSNLTALGSPTFLAVLVVILYLVGDKRLSKELGLAGIISGGIAFVLKVAIRAPRPHEAATILQFGFPSGHTALAFTAALIVGKENERIEGWLVLLAVLVGISRIWLGVHYPVDVLGGALIGLITGSLVNRNWKVFEERLV